MNTNTTPTIPEEQVAALLRAQIGRLVNGRPLHHVSLSVSSHYGEEQPEKAWIHYYAQALDHAGKNQCGAGDTLENAIADLAKEITPFVPAEVAAEKRAQAVRLLAEADKLDPAPQAEAAQPEGGR